MRLYIGKRYEGGAAVESIFRLIGNDEDALTYALGFLLAHDRTFCARLIRLLRLAHGQRLSDDYAVHLQEVSGQSGGGEYGRRDIVLEDNETRIVLEAKVGGAEPTVEQLTKYATESKLWEQYKNRYMVALTQVELAEGTRQEARTRLAEHEIEFISRQWHEIVELVLSYRPQDGSEVTRYLFSQFAHYIRRDYGMGYYDAEILIQDVNLKNADIFENGWMYVTATKDKKAPLYFAPYFIKRVTDNGIFKSGISRISRVLAIEVAKFPEKSEISVKPPSDEHHKHWEKGLQKLRERAEEEERFGSEPVQLLYLDKPIDLWPSPLTKEASKKANLDKEIPNQIPKGFSLTFDQLLRYGASLR